MQIVVAAIACSLCGIQPESENPPENIVIVSDFGEKAKAWQDINDDVMGGISFSQMKLSDGIATFEGRLSLENNGGFASVRSENLGIPIDGTDHIHLRVRGDGKRYQVRIRTTDTWDGPSYRASFDTVKDEWIRVAIPYEAFSLTYRGREYAEYPPLDPSAVSTVGILIADKQEGPFKLKIDWIGASKVIDAPDS